MIVSLKFLYPAVEIQDWGNICIKMEYVISRMLITVPLWCINAVSAIVMPNPCNVGVVNCFQKKHLLNNSGSLDLEMDACDLSTFPEYCFDVIIDKGKQNLSRLSCDWFIF